MLRGSLVGIEEITDLNTLFDLMNRHYDGVSKEEFQSDLERKDGVILLKDQGDVVRGFSTYQFVDTTLKGKAITALFSGDTVIERDYWGDSALFRTFGKLLHHSIGSRENLYWFLISKGVRTYQILPLFFHQFYPHVEEKTPQEITSLIRHLTDLMYPGRYSDGIVRADSYYLKRSMADIPNGKCANPHVEFFLKKNPGWREGDELACVAELSRENLNRSGLKMVRDWAH